MATELHKIADCSCHIGKKVRVMKVLWIVIQGIKTKELIPISRIYCNYCGE